MKPTVLQAAFPAGAKGVGELPADVDVGVPTATEAETSRPIGSRGSEFMVYYTISIIRNPQNSIGNDESTPMLVGSGTEGASTYDVLSHVFVRPRCRS